MSESTTEKQRTGEIVASKYQIDRLVGEGRSGRVYLAHHLVTGRKVALKWMIHRDDTDADDVERFVREAHAVARVDHPNIVDIYDVGQAQGAVFLVMEYLRGEPLSALLEGAPLSAGPTIRLLLPAMRALHAAHEAGVIHRDLKPQNLFAVRDAQGHLRTSKVLDFGIAKQVGAEDEATLTHTGVVMGSPHYMAPEQAEDARNVDARVDVYAMGVTLYQALSGELPYRANNLPGLLLKITRGGARPLAAHRPDLPAALCASVDRAMARDATARFATMLALLRALEPFASEGQVLPAKLESGPNAAPAASCEKSRGRPRRPWLIGSALVCAAVLAILWWARGQSGPVDTSASGRASRTSHDHVMANPHARAANPWSDVQAVPEEDHEAIEVSRASTPVPRASIPATTKREHGAVPRAAAPPSDRRELAPRARSSRAPRGPAAEDTSARSRRPTPTAGHRLGIELTPSQF